MSVFSKIFRKTAHSQNLAKSENPKAHAISELGSFLDSLLSSDTYIAKSDYLKKLESCKETVSYFQQLKKDDLLSDFCKKNKISDDEILSVLEKYSDIKNLVATHNENFIAQKLESEKSYLDSILRDIDPAIMLDDDQRRVVLTDEDYCLVIAGAGAGKRR